MTTTIDQSRRAASHYAGPGRVVAALLVALLALPLTGCRDSVSGIDPAPRPASTQEYIPQHDSSGYVDEPYVYRDEPGDYTDEPNPYGDEPYVSPDEPGSGTDPARSRATCSVRTRGSRSHRRS